MQLLVGVDGGQLGDLDRPIADARLLAGRAGGRRRGQVADAGIVRVGAVVDAR